MLVNQADQTLNVNESIKEKFKNFTLKLAVMDTIEIYSNIPFQTILIFDDIPFKPFPGAVKSEPFTSCFSEI